MVKKTHFRSIFVAPDEFEPASKFPSSEKHMDAMKLDEFDIDSTLMAQIRELCKSFHLNGI